MSLIFNADEVFKIGVQIEKNGREFYLAAASKVTDPDLKKLFTSLADWEKKHVSTFEEFRSALPSTIKNENIYDPENTIHLYLKSVADSTVFVQGIDTDEMIASCKSPVDILKKALGFEKDSVVFYSSMKSITPENLGKVDLDKIILEELNHIGMLTKEINKLES